MADAVVETDALQAGIKSLTAVGDRLVKLVADERLDDEREVIGAISRAMNNVRKEVTDVSSKLDVVQQDVKQLDVVRQQARNAEAKQKQDAVDHRTAMQLMAVGCVVACVATGIVMRWWYAPTPVSAVIEQRVPVSVQPVPTGAVTPVVNGVDATSPVDTSAPPQATGDYACAFGYGRQPGLNCLEDVRGATGQNRSTRTVR